MSAQKVTKQQKEKKKERKRDEERGELQKTGKEGRKLRRSAGDLTVQVVGQQQISLSATALMDCTLAAGEQGADAGQPASVSRLPSAWAGGGGGELF